MDIANIFQLWHRGGFPVTVSLQSVSEESESEDHKRFRHMKIQQASRGYI